MIIRHGRLAHHKVHVFETEHEVSSPLLLTNVTHAMPTVKITSMESGVGLASTGSLDAWHYSLVLQYLQLAKHVLSTSEYTLGPLVVVLHQ